ncbi:MAG: mevalonate kinase [Chloroflexi bacterium]|nr:mevalonate kinase [Chloroflexota bacterium]MQC26046.1 mevalonate kinase [Chloroflexota bacterium]
MPASIASAPGKVILFGEHAVVYGQPAIAVPVADVQAKAIVQPDIGAPSGQVHIHSEATQLDGLLQDFGENEPVAAALRLTLRKFGIDTPPAFKLRIQSSIPVAAGLGSGAAVSVAIIRAVSDFLGHPLPDEAVSALAYEVEKLHHGTPSGIDNAVVTFAKPVYFVRDQTLEAFQVGAPFTLVIGDTGVASPTRAAVEDVRTAWRADQNRYEALFGEIGALSNLARKKIEQGEIESVGPLMDANQKLLHAIGVSTSELDTLIQAARQAGASGAKLSGGGRGGNMIALAPEGSAQAISEALFEAGATNTIVTTVQ